VSIGCGPATEIIAIEKIMRDKSITKTCQYFGFDFNPIWNSVQKILTNIFLSNNCNLSFQNELLSNNPVLQNTKLLILNHVVSDVYKHAQKNSRADALAFLQNDINPIIQQMPSNSYILINDVNSYNMGRDEIETWVNQSNCFFNIIEIGYFLNQGYPDQAKFKDIRAKKRMDRDSVFFGSNIVCQSAYVILKRKDNDY
jgi:hypothetical protein